MPSFIWKHFTLTDNGEALCKYCSASYNTKRTTSSLRYHVKTKHQDRVSITAVDDKSDSDDNTVVSAIDETDSDCIESDLTVSRDNTVTQNAPGCSNNISARRRDRDCAGINERHVSDAPASKRRRKNFDERRDDSQKCYEIENRENLRSSKMFIETGDWKLNEFLKFKNLFNTLIIQHDFCKHNKNPKSESITRSFVKMIAMDMLPLSFGEGFGFQQFLQTVVPTYTLPSRTSIRSRLKEMYESSKTRILKIIDKFSSVALTTDAWSSRNTTSFITVTLHAIDDSWNLISYTLDTVEVPERHTAQNLQFHLLRVIAEWNITGKVVAVVHDNASNILAAMRLSSELGESVRCFSHSLQCCLNKALENDEIGNILKVVSAVVGHFKHSNIASAALKSAQNQLSIPEHRLISSCKTRWNSAFDMAERLVEQREAVNEVLENREQTSERIAVKLRLTSRQWKILESIVKVLRPFKVATTVMSTESHSTIAMIRPLVHSFLKKFLKEDAQETETVEEVKSVVRDQLQTRFMTNDVGASAIACILDPRYKNLPSETQDFRDRVKVRLAEMMSGNPGSGSLVAAIAAEKDRRVAALDYLFDDDVVLSQNLQQNMNIDEDREDSELENYFKEPILPRSEDPLIWWNSHRSRFPTLARIAKKYLAIPSSSTPSERVFSTAGNIITSKRNCLSPDNANILIFLYQNRDILK